MTSKVTSIIWFKSKYNQDIFMFIILLWFLVIPWLLIPVFLPGEFHGQRSLESYSSFSLSYLKEKFNFFFFTLSQDAFLGGCSEFFLQSFSYYILRSFHRSATGSFIFPHFTEVPLVLLYFLKWSKIAISGTLMLLFIWLGGILLEHAFYDLPPHFPLAPQKSTP